MNAPWFAWESGVWLNVDKLAVEQLLCTIDSKVLGNIDILAAAIVTAARIPFRILVGHHGALCIHNSARDDVLGGNQLNFVLLTAEFL